MRALLFLACFAAACVTSTACAQSLQPLSDDALSDVRGRDGVSFELSGFAMSGNARATFTAAPGRSIWVDSLHASRSDSPAAFADPYRLDIVPGASGLADVIRFDLPVNADGAQRWQKSFDLGVEADGAASSVDVVFSDMVFRGGGWQFSTPRVADGVAFGAALQLEIGQLALRPAGRENAGEQMALQGIRIGAVDESGVFTGAPWKIADVASQPAVINAVADANGPRLHIGIDWPDAQHGSGLAPAGGIQVDRISFASPATGVTDLGSSRIGAVQINYLDIKFR